MKNKIKKIAIILIFMCFKIPVEAQNDNTINVYICRVVKDVEKKMLFADTEPNIREFINTFGAPIRIARTTSEMYLERGYYFLNVGDDDDGDANMAVFIQLLDDSLVAPEIIALNGGIRSVPTYFEDFELRRTTTFFIRLNEFAIRIGDDIRPVFNQFPTGYKIIYDDSDDAAFNIPASTDISIGFNKITNKITYIHRTPY